MKKDLNEKDLPPCGSDGSAIPHTDLRKNQAVFVVDSSGDGWSIARVQPELNVSMANEDGTRRDSIEKVTGVFLQVVIPTTYWEPHRE